MLDYSVSPRKEKSRRHTLRLKKFANWRQKLYPHKKRKFLPLRPFLHRNSAENAFAYETVINGRISVSDQKRAEFPTGFLLILFSPQDSPLAFSNHKPRIDLFTVNMVEPVGNRYFFCFLPALPFPGNSSHLLKNSSSYSSFPNSIHTYRTTRYKAGVFQHTAC